ncbi:hypothetical protein [Pseudomonas sp. LS-2]|jgi:hypothetical protein|nr:hypothetical protein [Pseudomonas sp. LS-2]
MKTSRKMLPYVVFGLIAAGMASSASAGLLTDLLDETGSYIDYLIGALV